MTDRLAKATRSFRSLAQAKRRIGRKNAGTKRAGYINGTHFQEKMRSPTATTLEWGACRGKARVARAPQWSIKEQLTFSPDLGDAAALTFAVDLSSTQSINFELS